MSSETNLRVHLTAASQAVGITVYNRTSASWNDLRTNWNII